MGKRLGLIKKIPSSGWLSLFIVMVGKDNAVACERYNFVKKEIPIKNKNRIRD